MREIKFRAWDIKNKRTLQIVKIALDDELCCGYVLGTKEYVIVEDIELRQYTGLKDKNDKEIYQGDIVTIDTYTHEEPFNSYEGEIGIGSYGIGLLGCDCNGDHDFYYLNEIMNSINIIEVIGNIYENKELLEGDNS